MGTAVFAIWCTNRSWWILLIAAAAFLHAAVLTVAQRMADSNRVGHAVVLVNATVWPLTIVGALVAPISLPITSISSIPAALLAIAYLPLTAGRRLLVGAGVVTLIVTLLSRFTDVTRIADRVDPTIIDVVQCSLVPALVMLISGIGWQNHRVLAERAAELVSSRARLLDAAEDERRAVDADVRETVRVHIQSAIDSIDAALGFALDGGDPTREPNDGRARADDELQQATGELHAAIGDLRKVVTRLRPAALHEHGLGESLRTALRSHRLDDRFSLTITDVGRYPDGIEGALWFGCLESITALERIADATNCSLTVEGTGAAIRFASTVHEPRPASRRDLGSVVRAIDDRLAVVDGWASITIDEPAEGGRWTTIAGVVPAVDRQAVMAK